MTKTRMVEILCPSKKRRRIVIPEKYFDPEKEDMGIVDIDCYIGGRECARKTSGRPGSISVTHLPGFHCCNERESSCPDDCYGFEISIEDGKVISGDRLIDPDLEGHKKLERISFAKLIQYPIGSQ